MSDDYQSPFVFGGTLNKVEIDLSADNLSPGQKGELDQLFRKADLQSSSEPGEVRVSACGPCRTYGAPRSDVCLLGKELTSLVHHRGGSS